MVKTITNSIDSSILVEKHNTDLKFLKIFIYENIILNHFNKNENFG